MKKHIINQVKKFKVLYVQVPQGGGSLIAMYEMIKELSAEVEPVILCFYKNKFSQILHTLPGCKIIYLFQEPSLVNGTLIKAGFDLIVNPLKVLMHTLRKYFINDAKLVKRVYDIIINEQPDIIHHNNDVGLNAVAIRAASKAGIVQIMHNRSLSWYNKNKVQYFFYKRLVKNIQCTINISFAVQRHYNLLFPHLENKSTVIHDFVDTSKFKTAVCNNSIKEEFKIKTNDFIITNIGRITEWKGQHVLIEAVNLIKEKISNFKVLIAGSYESGVGSQNYFKQLKALASSCQLEDKIIFTGNREDVSKIIQCSDAIVHTAIQSEPQGLVIIEALLCKKTVIASNAGGAAELIKKYGGELTEPGNAAMLAEKILGLYNKKLNGLSNQSSINFSQLIKDFDPATKKEEIMSIYKNNYRLHVP